MTAPQGLVRFPGIQQIKEADFTLSHGISPGSCSVALAPQAGFVAETGTLLFTFGGAPVVSFADCKIDSASYQRDGSGRVVRLSILDRRWKWREGEISGSYNTRNAKGEIEPDRERTPKQLAQLCLEAMHEPAFDLSQLPDDDRPEVQWDIENPAQALDRLVNELGCRVVPRLDGSVLIARAGVGAELPGGYVQDDSGSLELPEKPYALRIVCGPKRFQGNFRLRAVGEETDGSIVPLDDLSYKPANGWSKIDFPHFKNVAEASRPLAKKSVFRWYRIHYSVDQQNEALFIDGHGLIFTGYQLLPIEDVQVLTYEDVGLAPPLGAAANAERKHPLPAFVTGVFREHGSRPRNAEADTPLKDGYRINRERGLVEFDRYTFKYIDDDDWDQGIEEAQLDLACAVSVRDPTTWEWVRHRAEVVIGTTPTPPRVLKHDEIVLNYAAGEPLNQAEVDAATQHYLTAAAQEFQTQVGHHRTYGGLLSIDLDGAIQQVAWHVGPPHASTQVSRNNEFSLVVPSYKERQRREQSRAGTLARLEEEVKRLKQREAAR